MRGEAPLRTAWFEDGSAELGFGVWLLLFGTTYLVVAGVPAHWLGLALWASNLAMAGITLIDLQVVRQLKRRVTFPRVGYAEPRLLSPGGQAALLALFITLFVAALA